MPQVSKRGCLARSAGLLTTIETVHSSQVQLRSREAQAHDSVQQSLTTVKTRIVVDKSTDNAKSHSIRFLPPFYILK